MNQPADDRIASRRAFLRNATLLTGALLVPGCARVGETPPGVATVDPLDLDKLRPAPAPVPPSRYATPAGVRHELFQRAVASLDRHEAQWQLKRDRIAIADFTPFSAKPRLQLINLHDGSVRNLLVTHGSGSDREHSGFLREFSNVPDSEATSQGAYRTAEYYVGQHGSSQRLNGLDPTNDKAFDRAIVIHAAWYANDDMIQKHGMIGRSQGCFAVGEDKLASLFEYLGEGRLIYADRV